MAQYNEIYIHILIAPCNNISVYSFRKQKTAAALTIAVDPPVGIQKNFSAKCVAIPQNIGI